MVKILFAIDGLRSGGKERRFISLLKALEEDNGFECEVIIFNKDVHYKEIFELDTKLHFLIRKTTKDITIFYSFYKVVKKFKPDILHVWDTLSNLYAIPTAKLLNTKLITSKITDAPPKYNKKSGFGLVSELCFKTADLILANSQAGIEAYRVPKRKSKVIYNGFDFKRIKNLLSKEELIKSLNIKEDKIISMVASFSGNKDFKTFLEAAKIVRKENKSIAFVCVGDGQLREVLQKKYQQDGIYFLGSRNDVEQIMNVSNIGVLISNNMKHGEGISNALMEFMALGKVVIASDNGGNSELINNGYSGIIISDNNSNTLATEILRLLVNDNIVKEMALNATKIIRNHFSIDKMVNEFIEVYKEVQRN